MRASARFCGALVLAAAIGAPPLRAAAAAGAPPFIVTASNGPAAGSRIVATVTRSVSGTSVTLPAALVPALRPGDVVDVDFPDYRRPPSSVNYHVNVAFITETAPQRWYFEHGVPADRLFRNDRNGKRSPATSAGRLHFVYGTKYYRGIPIFTIIPEDAKTRGVDGVRDYLNAHPTDFVAMSQSTNDAVDEYDALSDFLISLANGSIDTAASRERIESVAQGAGVPAATVDACYTAGGSQADVSACVQQAISSTVYQTNFVAPTRSQFLGGVVGAAEPATYAPYIGALLTVWNIFVHTGHLEYEYLPATITMADPSSARPDELLMGLKIPTIRPPAAASDVLFFTIGDPKATEHTPVVVNDAPANGICELSDRFSIPLHFDHTSRYVHDAKLVVAPDGRTPLSIPLDPRSLDAPVVDRSRFPASSDGAYTVSLSGRFGFDPVLQPSRVSMRMAIPAVVPWHIAMVAHHPPIAGGTLDVVASSVQAPCLSHAEVQIGSAPPVPLKATPLDDQRVELSGPLADLPAGAAELRLYEDDPRLQRELETNVTLAIQPPPAEVDLKSAVAALGDAFVRLTGSGFERIRALVVDGLTYTKEPGADATTACFDGPPLRRTGLTVGEHVSAQLVTSDGSPGEVFPLALAPARPELSQAVMPSPEPAVHLSTTPLTVVLESTSVPLPRQVAVRVRQAVTAGSPCASLPVDPTAVTLSDASLQPRSPTVLAVDLRPDILGDRAFGELEMRVVDRASGLGSAWVPLSGAFVRAPEVSQILCPSAGTAPCRIYGSDLASIDAVADASGAFVKPGLDCPPTDKGVACVYVPRLAHYTLRLVDGATIENLPDTLLAH